MKKIVVTFLLNTICVAGWADGLDLYDALRATYQNCVEIDNELADLKKMAGINTAVTGLGTGLGIGATVVGLSKANIDKQIEEKFNTMKNVSYGASGNMVVVSSEDFIDSFAQFLQQKLNDNSVKVTDIQEGVPANEIKKLLDEQNEEKKRELTEKSKKLGRWRTGLIAGNTVTNVAGAVIAGNNKVDQPLQNQITNCVQSVKNLQNAIIQARFDGKDVTEAQQIVSACGGFEYVDISKINKRATGSMVSSIVGSGTGVAGTITSALANTDSIRNDDSPDGKKKEKNLNTAANVLAASSTVASATATVFNASQIKAIKDVAKIAQQCTEVLK